MNASVVVWASDFVRIVLVHSDDGPWREDGRQALILDSNRMLEVETVTGHDLLGVPRWEKAPMWVDSKMVSSGYLRSVVGPLARALYELVGRGDA